MITSILALPLASIFLLSLVFLVLSAVFGCRLGAHSRGPGGATAGIIAGAILSLLGLMLGFTFSMALTRYDARRDAMVREATSIGTTALRARLLAPAIAAESLTLLRDYTRIRLDLASRPLSDQEADVEIARSNDIQEKLWRQTKTAVAANDSMVPTGLYINALNEMIDDQARRVSAIRNRVPVVVILGLYGLATIAVGFTGYAVGMEKLASRIPVCILSAVVALVLLLIQDINRPTAGVMQISQQPILDVAASIDMYLK